MSPAIAYIDSSTWFGASDPSFDGAHPLAPAHMNKIAPLAGNALRPLLYPPARTLVCLLSDGQTDGWASARPPGQMDGQPVRPDGRFVGAHGAAPHRRRRPPG